LAQARRLFGLREDICVRVLNTAAMVNNESVYARRATRA
jgi:hypothetical protein